MAVPRSLLHIDGADEASLSACFWGSASAWLIEQKKKKKKMGEKEKRLWVFCCT